MNYIYEVALSFAGEDRAFAEAVAKGLRDAGVKVFYDDFYAEDLWGEDLAVKLRDVYHSSSQFCIMIISKHYVDKMWPSHERQQAIERMIKERGKAYVLPVRLDGFNGEVPGLSGAISYLAVRSSDHQKIVDAFLTKIKLRGSEGEPKPESWREATEPYTAKIKEFSIDVEIGSFLKDMPSFQEVSNKSPCAVDPKKDSYNTIIKEWARWISRQFQKKLIPLFITGSGISMDRVLDMNGIMKELKNQYDEIKQGIDQEITDYIDRLFDTFGTWSDNGNNDRSIVGRILNEFQNNESPLYDTWLELNKTLLKNVINAEPTFSHDILGKFYEDLGAICLTLNFDGLLIKKLKENGKTAFSIPDEKECEKYFLRTGTSEEFIEIQARGDILYLVCKGTRHGNGYCPEKDQLRPLWSNFPEDMSKDPSYKERFYNTAIRCPCCNGERSSYLSFPGSYEKEKAMQKILTVVWRYLSFRVSCITVIGLSGWWDPQIIAFIGDLVEERKIPLLVIDTDPKSSYLIRELVVPPAVASVALECNHIDFMDALYKETSRVTDFDPNFELITKHPYPDTYWDKSETIRDPYLRNGINTPISELEKHLIEEEMKKKYRLHHYAQLGLKSRWLGIYHDETKYHTRLFHSIGVLKIASFLYEKVCKENAVDNEKEFLRIAALLHDIGHLPFCHLIEEIFQDLNWKPAKYEESFTHSLNTTENIKDIFDKNEYLRNQLSSLGYSVQDLERLINGKFGVGFLDAIINSPIDADKIDYIFRDTSSTDKRIILSPEQFMKDITSELSMTPEKMLAFSGISAKAAIELLETRNFLYNNLYLRSGIRFLESAVKFIIITYFVHWIEFQKENLKEYQGPFSDFGDYKISACVDQLKKLAMETTKKGDSDELELEMIRKMKDYLLSQKILSNKITQAIELCFEKIEQTKGEDDLKRVEKDIIYLVSKKMSDTERRIYEEAAKSCMLRLPGAMLIDILKPPRFLSIADARKERERSDGTRTYSECIIVPRGNHRKWSPDSKADSSLLGFQFDQSENEVIIRLFPISIDKTYSNQALNLFIKLLDEKGKKDVGQDETYKNNKPLS